MRNVAVFNSIDFENWERKEYYNYYINIIKCRYSMTVNIDVTELLSVCKDRNVKFFNAFMYAILKTVNSHKEFRMAKDKEGNLGYWDYVVPTYTIFHKDTETFSDIWSEYSDDFSVFYDETLKDMEKYKDVHKIKAREDFPPNTCPISCVPWVTFSGYSIDAPVDAPMLIPVFTFGKYFNESEKIKVPLAMYIHHAVADGFHTSRLFNDIQLLCDNSRDWIYKR